MNSRCSIFASAPLDADKETRVIVSFSLSLSLSLSAFQVYLPKLLSPVTNIRIEMFAKCSHYLCRNCHICILITKAVSIFCDHKLWSVFYIKNITLDHDHMSFYIKCSSWKFYLRSTRSQKFAPNAISHEKTSRPYSQENIIYREYYYVDTT